MGFEPTVCLSPADVDVVCVARKKTLRAPRAPSHIWTDEETIVFLSLMQGDETFNEAEAEVAVAAEIALLRFRRHFSPWLFEKSGQCHSIMPSLFIPFKN